MKLEFSETTAATPLLNTPSVANNHKHETKEKLRADPVPQGASAAPFYGKDAHKRAAKCFEYALTLGTTDAWSEVSAVWTARLTKAERAAQAYAALKALDRDTASMTASAVLFGTLDGVMLAGESGGWS